LKCEYIYYLGGTKMKVGVIGATSYPSTCANALAIPWPIVPAPITPTFILIPPKIYYGAKALSAKPLQHNLIIYIN
jgi:hypothetical protein